MAQLKVDDRPTIIPAPGKSDTIFVKRNENPFTLKDVRVEGADRTCILSPERQFWRQDWDVRRVLCYGTGPTLWGARLYDAAGYFEDFDFKVVGQFSGGEKHEGHAMYFNVAGGLYFQRCSARACGGQFIQLVTRPSEGVAPDPSDDEEVIVDRCACKNVGLLAGRASFPISLYATGLPMRIQSCWITQTDLPDFNAGGEPRNSRGGILTEADLKHGGPSQTPYFEVKDTVVELNRSDRAAIKLRHCKEALVQGGLLVDHADGFDAVIEVYTEVEKLTVKNVLGPNVRIVVRGEDGKKIREEPYPGGTWVFNP